MAVSTAPRSLVVSLGNGPRRMQRKTQQPARHVQCSVAAFERGLQETGTRPFPEPQHKYLLGELLGSGTAARVVVGTDTATQAQYAVKILPKQRGAKNRTEQIKQEVSSWGCSQRYSSHSAVSRTGLGMAAVNVVAQWQLLAPLPDEASDSCWPLHSRPKPPLTSFRVYSQPGITQGFLLC